MTDTKMPDLRPRFSRDIIRGSLPWIELTACLILIAIMTSYVLNARALPAPYNAVDIGAGGFPKLIGIATLIGLIAVAVNAVVRLLRNAAPEMMAVRRPLSVLFCIVVFIIQGIYFEQIGTLLSILIFSVAVLLLCGENRPAHLIGVPVALAAFVYGVFVIALAVNLP